MHLYRKILYGKGPRLLGHPSEGDTLVLMICIYIAHIRRPNNNNNSNNNNNNSNSYNKRSQNIATLFVSVVLKSDIFFIYIFSASKQHLC